MKPGNAIFEEKMKKSEKEEEIERNEYELPEEEVRSDVADDDGMPRSDKANYPSNKMNKQYEKESSVPEHEDVWDEVNED